jgi:hypothetical protein
MTDNVENLILEHLRALRAGQDRIEQEQREVQARLTSLEPAVLGTKREVLHTQEERARRQLSIDGIKERLLRVERRLDLADPAH